MIFSLIIVLVCGLANFLCSILILRTLKASGVHVGFYELRWQVHKHLKTYKEITLAETGRIGLPFYGYWISLGGLVLSGVLLFVSLSQQPSEH